MPKLFISYRREDSQWPADQLHRAMKRYVDDPKGDLFIDVDSMPLGLDFVQHLRKTVAQCDILLAVIGPGWLGVVDRTTGRRRLDDPNDFVRVEIATAIASNVRVVPILLDGAVFPQASDLPEELAPLTIRAGVEVRRLSFESDVERLADGLGLKARDRVTSGQSSLRRFGVLASLVAIVAAIGLLAAVISNIMRPAEKVSESAAAYQALTVDDPKAHRAFLDAFPESSEAPAVTARLLAIDDRLWAAAFEKGTTASLEKYFASFPMDTQPSGRHLVEAAGLLDRARRVESLQAALIEKGLLVGVADGRLDDVTVDAVALFGRASGQEVTEIDVSSLESLSIVSGQVMSWDETLAPSFKEPLVALDRGRACTTQPTPFVVYWEFERTSLTATNEDTIRSSVYRATGKGCRISFAYISSPTSRERILVVKNLLIQLGVVENRIKTEFDPNDVAQPGPNPEREPLNRIVEVQLTIAR